MASKIGIDCRFAHTQTGLGRYSRELVSHLLMRKDGIEYVLFASPLAEEWLVTLPQTAVHLTSASHYSLEEQIKFSRLLKKSNIDLLFSLHFNVPFYCPVSFVATIHDLILHRYPNRASPFKQSAYKILMNRTVRKAKHLIAVSHFTASELVDVFGKRIAKKTSVIHEGVSPAFSRRDETEQARFRDTYDLHHPFYLYVGNAKEHKNVQMLIDAFTSLPYSDTKLVLVTGGKELAHLKLNDRVRVIPEVKDLDLPALYSAARAFITASLYEGFGLPVAEAAACGCPVIAVNRSAVPEVAPEGARLIEPTILDIAHALQSVPGPQTPKKFLWEDAAEKTVQVLLNM